MFKSSKEPALPPSTDYTGTLREHSFYKYGHLRTLGLTGEVTAWAVDPVLSLLAVGTSSGMFALPVSATLPGLDRKPDGVKFVAFHPGHARLVVVDEGSTIHAFALNHISESANPNASPPLPVREAFFTLFGTITAVEQPLPSYTHMLFTMRDGTTLAWDLRQRGMSSYNIPNLLAMHEERLVRSGVPGKKKTLGGPQATAIAINPRDLNILLIGYEGGVVAWNFQKAAVDKVFEMVLPPGAPGGGGYQDSTLWTERTPSVTSISWRPDGLVFVVGHADGCLSFWAYADAEKPLTVRTLTHEDVNITDAESLMEAGALDNQIRTKHDFEGMPVLTAAGANREPVFKLAWAGFPDAAAAKALATAQAADPTAVPVSNATMDYAERGETLLLVLGGQSPGEKPGINIIQFPAYQQPLANKGAAASAISELMSLNHRSAYRDSLAPTGWSNYPTKTPPEDFMLLPRSSPYFGMAHDAISLFILLTPDDKLPKPYKATPERQVEAYVFPPPRSSVAPEALGRKNYATPGEGENLVAFTPAPVRNSLPQRKSSSSWRFPWSAGGPEIPSPSSATTPQLANSGIVLEKIKRRQRLPSSLWSGGLATLGCKISSLPTPTFKRLIAQQLKVDGTPQDPVPRVPLRGGLAVPDLQSHGAPDVKVVKMENYRILTTWHADATVRFWDASTHLLVLPTPLRFEYPSPLPHLTIRVGEYLRHPDLLHLPLAKLWATNRSKVQITGVHLARESLECVITFNTGEVIVTKFGEGKGEQHHRVSPTGTIHEDEDERDPASPRLDYFPPQPKEHEEFVEEVTEIGHLARWSQDGFKPVAVFTVRRGEVISCAVSDIGFIAVAYSSNSLAILDMRGPDVILREGFNEEGKTMKRRKRKGNVQNFGSENSPIGAMKWTISGVGGDVGGRPRLVVSYAKGMTKIYGLVNVLGEWMVEQKPPTFVNESLAFPLATYVLDPETGNELFASPEALAGHLEGGGDADGKFSKEAPPHCLWIAASRKAIRVSVNYNGERVAKVEFEREELSDVHYITRHGHRVIVALTTTGSALFYSAPRLEYITRMDLFFGSEPRPIGKLSFDDRSGDFIEYTGPLDIALRTLFHFRKPFPPRIDPCVLKTPVPSQPLPVTYSLLGWMMGAGLLSGASLDNIVGGPNRPQPPKPPPAPRKPLITWGEPPAAAPRPAANGTAPKRPAVSKQRPPRSDLRERKDV
ncbi:hypothetical protein VHUM_00675 [Vanrija humicola]|uniref:Lethal giant larvae (Lgl)-like C-terminal domain-containing protein n=1 Tax=Vanrija humicola TaxID=5417 RepID=A0A7D8Z1V3_VANHU|nr:hypothetical protein VHUM_00675 [Vanrija humicola]